ncbi:MAG: hypothetical protein HY951_06885 [Bacteroidia bacterium]|nr:hypothetical protein [Bacteroidia bacterium]
MAKKKSHKLIVNYSIPFTVFGIISSEKGFVVSNELNNLLNTNLSLTKQIELIINGNVKLFDAFSFRTDDTGMMYSLLSISSSTGPLIEFYKNIDYFLIISGTIETINVKEIINNIKSPIFLAVSRVEIKQKKEKEIFQEILQQLWI